MNPKTSQPIVKRLTLAKAPDAASNKNGKVSLRLLAQFCYYYPAYTLADARELSYRHVAVMLKEARKLEAQKYYNLTQIAAAPHTKKMAGVEQLTSRFKGVMNG